MLVDANVLLYAANRSSPFHGRAKAWLSERLQGPRRVGLPWTCLLAVVRIGTDPKVYADPLEPAKAIELVRGWLSSDVAWIPQPGPRHLDILEELVIRYHLRGRVVTDVHLAALAIEHGLELCSADTGFARFSELRWRNPVSPP